ncbi:hypothetical protein [Maridesulfovibrio sp.]|uniref:hypothetical protein n=1 Tax=Maridesulfovibrio sp. TaxID=2795000 RepID=UPI002A18C8C3|nr:hypothetical protein [Maridesulfovibrio sp.]
MGDSNYDVTAAAGGMAKSGGDILQGQCIGSYMGSQADNSNEGWGTSGDQADSGSQSGIGGDVTDNVDIGSINISS